MALNEQEEAKVRELLEAFENGKRINELDPAEGELSAMRIEVMDASGETRSIELERAVAEAGNPVAGRWWANDQATPTAGGWFGSVDALRKLPETLGLGRYLVTDDLGMRKLDPKDSTKFADGSPAALDGSMGQCMWCWNRAWYFTEMVTAGRTYWAVTLKPIEGQKSVRIPVGGLSWMDAGVMDRTEGKLCSVISEAERYRGGLGAALNAASYEKHPGAETPQMTMLGMPTVGQSSITYGVNARKRGAGWEANWYVARAAAQILFAVIMGTRNSQAPYCAELDADGLMQGGFGTGVTDIAGWAEYNGNMPVMPTSVGLELGDGCGLVDYGLPASENAADRGMPFKMLKVPVFFGLVNAGYGNVWRFVRGLTVSQEAGVKTEVYVARSMSAAFDPDSVAGMLKVGECPQGQSFIKRLSTAGLCMMPTEVGGSAATYYADLFYTNGASQSGLRACAAGGASNDGPGVGVFVVNAHTAPSAAPAHYSSPLCFFTEDPVVG